MLRKVTLIFSILLITTKSFSQDLDVQQTNQLDSAIALMSRGDYNNADLQMRSLMSQLEALPADLAYFFGRNSYHLDKYKQSINWLNKYIQLKGPQGRYYLEANKYLQLAEDQYIQLSRRPTTDIAKELSSGDYDCGGLSKMICPVCHGDGVVIKKGKFDNIYQTCPYSRGESFLSCEDYNLFMRGLLDPPSDK